jgi:hypothetical protein
MLCQIKWNQFSVLCQNLDLQPRALSIHLRKFELFLSRKTILLLKIAYFTQKYLNKQQIALSQFRKVYILDLPTT